MKLFFSLSLIYTIYYIYFPIVIGIFFIDDRVLFFNRMADTEYFSNEIQIFMLVLMVSFGLFLIYIFDSTVYCIKKIKPIYIDYSKILTTLLAAIIILLFPFYYDNYYLNKGGSILNTAYIALTNLAVAICMIINIGKFKFYNLILISISFLLLLTLGKRLEILSTLFLIFLVFVNKNNYPKKYILLGVSSILILAMLIGNFRSIVIRGEGGYLSQFLEPTFVFSTFLATIESGVNDISRIYSDFVAGILNAPPIIFRELYQPPLLFDLEAWGGDDYIRPNGGHHFLAQFYQAGGLYTIIIPYIIWIALLVITNKVFKYYNYLGFSLYITLCLSLPQSYRDHYYSLFRFVFYWFVFWVITPLILRWLAKTGKINKLNLG